jgi:signal transduction histidine kinase
MRVRADLPDTGLLGPVYVGPLAALGPLHARRSARGDGAVWVITVCLVIAGVFTAALWLQSRDAAYGWFATVAFAWAAIHLNLLLVTIPVTTTTWWGLWYVGLVAWAWALARFLLAFIGVDDVRFTRALSVLAAVGIVVLGTLLVVGSPWLHVAARLWITAMLPVLGVAAAKVVRLLRERGDDVAVVLPHVLGLSVVACAMHDWLVFLGLGGPTYDYFLPYAAPPVFVGMGAALLYRFVGALEASAALVADLERRVEVERVALERSYERLHLVERARVLAAERERILREMHDGLGSHLVSTLALLENDGAGRDAIGSAVRAALDDLRLMVDALEPLDGDLVGALAMLRARLQPRLEAAGIRVEWRVTDLPRIPELRAGTVLQILRILQEAVTNVLKHADARTLTVRTDGRSDGARPSVSVEIADDGCGFDVGRPGGRGMHHMRRRAAEIGAVLAVERTAPGTRVSLAIPLESGRE